MTSSSREAIRSWFKSGLADGQAAVRIGFAKFKIRLDDETDQCSPVMYLYLVAGASKTFTPSRRRCHGQVAGDDESSQQCQGEPSSMSHRISLFAGKV